MKDNEITLTLVGYYKKGDIFDSNLMFTPEFMEKWLDHVRCSFRNKGLFQSQKYYNVADITVNFGSI